MLQFYTMQPLERSHQGSTHQEIPMTAYAISLSEFQTPLSTSSLAYRAPEPWTRANFTAAFIDSFAKSRGSVTAQQTILEYYALHQNFDYHSTMLNFQLAGGTGCLSRQERSMIVDVFRTVERHSTHFIKEEGKPLTNRRIFTKVDNFAKQFSLPLDVSSILPISQDDLRTLSWTAFLRRLNEHITSVPR